MAKGKREYQPMGKTRSAHFSITVPHALLKKVDASAKKANLSRSFYVVEAVKMALGEVSKLGIST